MLLALVSAALVLWIGAAQYIHATLAAVLIVVLMVIFRVVSWNDVLGNAPAWNVFIWFSTLLTLAGGLVETQFVDRLARSVAPTFLDLDVILAILLLIGTFFFLHYLFATITAHTTALVPVFLGVAVTIPGFRLRLGRICSRIHLG